MGGGYAAYSFPLLRKSRLIARTVQCVKPTRHALFQDAFTPRIARRITYSSARQAGS